MIASKKKKKEKAKEKRNDHLNNVKMVSRKEQCKK